MAFITMIGSSIVLGSSFLAIGYLISTCVSERATAGGIAIGVWVLFVLIFDMALLGLLVSHSDVIGGGVCGYVKTNSTKAWTLILSI